VAEVASVVAAQSPVGVSPIGAKAVFVAKNWQDYISIDYLLGLVGGSVGALRLAFWGAGGFCAGYIIRRYAGVMITALAGALFIGALAEYFGVITFHWDVLQQFCGVSTSPDASSLANAWLLVRHNALFYSAGLIGFFAGHFLGEGDE